MDKNALNYTLKDWNNILLNDINTIFYNKKTGNYIRLVENGRSYGIWVGKKFLSIKKIDEQKTLIYNDYDDCSDALKKILIDLENI